MMYTKDEEKWVDKICELEQKIDNYKIIIITARNRILKDISMIKTINDMSNKEVIMRLEETVKVLERAIN